MNEDNEKLAQMLKIPLNEDGFFLFEDVPSGIITLGVRMEGYHSRAMTIEVLPGEVTEVIITLYRDE